MDPVTLDGLTSQVEVLRVRLDALDERTKSKEPWYKNASVLISIAAFLFSFGTTVVSYKRTSDQDVHSLRAELRGLLQRLAALPKENVDAFVKYGSDGGAYASISSFITQETVLLARQANDAIKRLPKEQVSATDYMAVAQAFQASNNPEAALNSIAEGLKVATEFDDEIAGLRAMSYLQIVTGHVVEGRATFERAMNIFYKYPTIDEFTKGATGVNTQLIWSNAEQMAGNGDLASGHIAKAQQIATGLPASPATDMVNRQIRQQQQNLSSGRPTLPPSGAAATDASAALGSLANPLAAPLGPVGPAQ